MKITGFRTKNWIHYLGFVLLGFFYYPNKTIHELIILLLTSASLLAYAYSFNDKIDLKQKGAKFLLPFATFIILLTQLNTLQKVLSLMFFSIVTTYSIPGIRLKRVPIINSLANNIGFLLLFLIAVNYEHVDISLIFFTTTLFLLQTAAQIIHEICHYNKDKKENVITTTVQFGAEKMKKIFKITLLLAIIPIIYFSKNIKNGFFITLPTIIFCVKHSTSKSKNWKKRRENYKNDGVLVGILYLINFLI